MVGAFLLFSVVLWYVIDWIKRFIGEFKVPELPYKIGLLVVAISGGILLALQFKLDAFVMLAQALNQPDIPSTITGQIFGGLILASGSGGVYELLKAVKGRWEIVDLGEVKISGPEMNDNMDVKALADKVTENLSKHINSDPPEDGRGA